MTSEVLYTIRVHQEDGVYWADVVELPGCFATGTDLTELGEALDEAVWNIENDSDESGDGD